MLLAEFIRAPQLAEPLARAEKKAREEIKDKNLEGIHELHIDFGYAVVS